MVDVLEVQHVVGIPGFILLQPLMTLVVSAVILDRLILHPADRIGFEAQIHSVQHEAGTMTTYTHPCSVFC